jgi:hypothetical protein
LLLVNFKKPVEGVNMRLLLRKGVLNLPRVGLHEGYSFVEASTFVVRSLLANTTNRKKRRIKNG